LKDSIANLEVRNNNYKIAGSTYYDIAVYYFNDKIIPTISNKYILKSLLCYLVYDIVKAKQILNEYMVINQDFIYSSQYNIVDNLINNRPLNLLSDLKGCIIDDWTFKMINKVQIKLSDDLI
jgi:hypothetical protein